MGRGPTFCHEGSGLVNLSSLDKEYDMPLFQALLFLIAVVLWFVAAFTSPARIHLGYLGAAFALLAFTAPTIVGAT